LAPAQISDEKVSIAPLMLLLIGSGLCFIGSKPKSCLQQATPPSLVEDPDPSRFWVAALPHLAKALRDWKQLFRVRA